ncbi:hypothetical protein JI75_08230 [Berryella intestinalis]|uniref:Uncharacterized protein n=1 Tax=Berryella intestinalis TaxID=1531429 RepID=A0A0A8B583_9ACTN|nr:hypothetical protein [Berryella intestinalis]AJC12636.1 hypothetical protein JI75_08230 [Berryella intestinalis]
MNVLSQKVTWALRWRTEIADRYFSLHQGLFIIFICIWIASIMVDATYLEVDGLTRIVRRLCQAGLFVNELVYGRVTKRDLVFLSGVSLVVVACVFAGENYLWTVLLAAFFMRNLNAKEVLTWIFIVQLIVLLTIVLLGVVGVMPTPPWVSENPDRIRHALGFEWYTYASHFLLSLILVYFYLKREKASWFVIVVLLAFNVVVFLLSDSRNSFALSLLVLGAMAAYKRWGSKLRRNKVFELAFIASVPICAVLSAIVFLGVPVDSDLGHQLNRVFSNRLAQTQLAFSQYDVSIFGNRIEWVTPIAVMSGKVASGANNYVDCSYLNILIRNGVLVSAVFLVLFVALVRKAVTGGDYVFGFIFLVFAIHSIVDPQLCMIAYCSFLLLFGKVLSSDDSWFVSSLTDAGLAGRKVTITERNASVRQIKPSKRSV